MIAMTLAEIAEVVYGEVHHDRDVVVKAEATIDSRGVVPGGLFIALVGEKADGHDFAAAAFDSGAAAVLGSRPVPGPCLVVADPVEALGRLARHVLDSLPATRVLALTGSQGKTGTKDYLAQVMQGAGDTVATEGNFNNEIGVPLTVLRADENTRWLVVEMGARGVGHIGYLCEIAPPAVAAVLNVGAAHIGEFGSIEAIARTKAEIIESLPATGVAVLNHDDERTRAMAGRTRASIRWFGADTGADVSTGAVSYDALGRPRFTLTYADESGAVALNQTGAHQVSNAAAAAAMALAAGVSMPAVVAGLSAATNRSPLRMDVTERADGLVLINDSYNANPASMRAAIDALVHVGTARSGRTLAVLGAMLELGTIHTDEHRAVGAYAVERGVDHVVVVGEQALGIAQGMGAEPAGVTVCAHHGEATAWLRTHVRPDDVVLFKASRGIALERVAEALLE